MCELTRAFHLGRFQSFPERGLQSAPQVAMIQAIGGLCSAHSQGASKRDKTNRELRRYFFSASHNPPYLKSMSLDLKQLISEHSGKLHSK